MRAHPDRGAPPLGMVTFPCRAHTRAMDECRHGLIAAVCAVCCRAEAEAASASQPERVLAGAGPASR
jgi:hypothetical protein